MWRRRRRFTLEQYLYFCTSKASKLSTKTALQSLESHLERCMEEASALEEYKAEAKDARRKLEQASKLVKHIQ